MPTGRYFPTRVGKHHLSNDVENVSEMEKKKNYAKGLLVIQRYIRTAENEGDRESITECSF